MNRRPTPLRATFAPVKVVVAAALIVVVFGGLGSLPGTILAAFVIGLIQATASTLFGTTWSLPMLYAVILLVLLVRPQGLLGRPMEARL